MVEKYHRDGWIQTQLNEKGETKEFAMVAGKPRVTKDFDGTRYEYNEKGKVVKITDPTGWVTENK